MKMMKTTALQQRGSNSSSSLVVLLLVGALVRFWQKRAPDDKNNQASSLATSLRTWLRQQGVRIAMRLSPQTPSPWSGPPGMVTTTAAAARVAPADDTEPEEEDSDNDDESSSSRDDGNPDNEATSASAVDTLAHVRAQHARIAALLDYWFVGPSTSMAQRHKQLWMIPDQNKAHRQTVDREILQRFGHLLLCDNNDNNGTDDSDNDDDNNDSTTEPLWKEWCRDTDLYGMHGPVAAIILLDQCGRHMHRCLAESAQHQQGDTSNTALLPSQARLDVAALAVATQFHEQFSAQSRALLALPLQVFASMPLRHSQQLSQLQGLQQAQITGWTTLQEEHAALLGRFRKATNRRLAVLQDAARRGAALPQDDDSKDDDKSSSTFTDEDILECVAFDVQDMKPATKHAVYQTMHAFLVAQQESQSPLQQQGRRQPVLVSLSGGVDSMVICAVLAHLARTSAACPIHVVAVHIDYANRPESAAEADFLRRWCAAQDIDYDCRRIDHVTRGVTARDDYERISRQVRFDFYRETMEACAGPGAADVGVFLGHHRGDLRENVLSNAHKGCGPLDLSGMTAVSRNDGVILWRPLLGLEKSAIFDYAHTFGVPYFKETTPHWSTRGKLRNRLLPLLEEIYGEGSLSNLSTLAVESDKCRALLHDVSFGPFLDKILRKPMGMVFQTTPWKDRDLFFWKFVLREALHSGSLGMFTDKAVASFLERVKLGKEGWLQCRKDYAVYLHANGDVFVLKSASFPWHKKDQYKIDSQAVAYGRENTIVVGPWRVTALIVPVHEAAEIQPRLECKALASMRHLMEGSIKYYVQVPTRQQEDGSFAPRPLIFRTFSKASRPLAWKSSDTKIQETLPLLGNDDDGLTALQDPIAANSVHTDETGAILPNPTALIKISICLHDIYPPPSPARAPRTSS
jgi:tRNA(Ile)-lysidine synthetase-like protein